MADTDKLVAVVQDRFDAGLESKMDLTQARLTRAQIQLQKIHLEDHADELRQHLSGLTGLDPNAITPAASSVPPLPDLDFQGLISKENSAPAVQAALPLRTPECMRHGEISGRKTGRSCTASFNMLDSPVSTVITSITNPTLLPNNIGIGINATWPIFDRMKHDKAEESAAIAKHDRQQAELVKDTE